MPSLNRILNSLQSLQYVKFSIDYIYEELLNLSNRINIDKKIYKTQNINELFINKLILKDVSFNYKINDKTIFNKLNLEIFKNKITGIVGESGSGKTTLLNLILGLLKPNSGSILIDNNYLEEYVSICREILVMFLNLFIS